MLYFIDFLPKCEKKIYKLDTKIRDDILKKIYKLKENPEQRGKHIRKNLYELYYSKNYRIYYRIFKGKVVIEDIEYEGRVRIERLGTKNTQKRDLKKL